MAAGKSVMVLFLMSVLWMSSSYGHTNADLEYDADDEWPVLCPPETFYNIKKEQCLACSQCPINKIIISPCQGLHDTKCGPFYDFKSFNAADGKNKGNITPYEQSGKDDSADFKDASLYEDQTSSEDIGTLETEWKSLTVALIVLVSVLFISVIFLVFYFLRRRNMNKKEIICEYSPPIEHV